MQKAEFQNMLDDIADAFMARDFQGYFKYVSLPLTHITGGGAKVHKTEAQVRELFDDYVDGLDMNAVDQIIRVCKTFADLHDGSYMGDVETHFLHRGRRIAEPHTSAFLVLDTDEGPKLSSVLGARNSREAKEIAPTIWES